MVYHILIAPVGLALLLSVWLAVERLAAAARNRARTEARHGLQSGAPAPCAACAAPCLPGLEPADARGGPREAARPSVRVEGARAPSNAKEDMP